MRGLRHPYVNAAVTCAISLVYAAVFIVTSGHLEFQRMLSHGQTLSSPFWNGFSAFVRQGNLRYIGYLYIAAAIFVVAFSWLRKKDYDEYQVRILTAGFTVTGAVMLLLFPAALLLVLSDPNYAIETILFLVVAHWSLFLGISLFCTIKWCRE